MKATFETVIRGFGNNAGIEVPDDVIATLGATKRPPVVVTIGSYSFKSTVGVMSGLSLISLSKAHRDASGLAAGDRVKVTLELDAGTREVLVPEELEQALAKAKLTKVFDALSYSRRKEFARQVSEAKAVDTRERRIAKIVDTLKSE
jgi:hypothetical protein